MAYKDLLVCLDPTPASDERLKLAIALAKAHGARIFGLDVTADAAFEGRWRERALQVSRYFDETTQAAKIEAGLIGSDYRQGGPSPDQSHCVDLILAPSPSAETRELVASFVPDELLLKSGAPTLLLAPEWTFRPLGESIVIAWDASREATRAVHDAMPLLEKAKKVVVFSFSRHRSALKVNAEALVRHLARHGVDAALSDWTNTGDISAVEALFASLETQDSDLIVAGGFGHSRLFEGLFGGVSLDLIGQPTLPVLLSH
jgi:nucleotide-binding universal stress UspA family protein